MSERDELAKGPRLREVIPGFTQLSLPGGVLVLFSGGVPVAAHIPADSGDTPTLAVRDSFEDLPAIDRSPIIDWFTEHVMKDGEKYHVGYRRGYWFNYLLTVPESYVS